MIDGWMADARVIEKLGQRARELGDFTSARALDQARHALITAASAMRDVASIPAKPSKKGNTGKTGRSSKRARNSAAWLEIARARGVDV